MFVELNFGKESTVEKEEVLPGVYLHKGGGRYRVLFVAMESTNARQPNRVVVYISLTYGTSHCRDLDEFVEVVEWPDGTRRSRFVLEENTDAVIRYGSRV